MTQIRKTTALVCAAIVAGAIAFLLGGQIGDAARWHSTPTGAASTGTFQLPAPAAAPKVDPLVQRTLGGGEASPEQVKMVEFAADRVCEGMTAQVPLVVLEPELVRETGIDGVTMHQFVKDTVELRCPTA